MVGEVVPAAVPECAVAEAADDDDEGEEDGVDDGGALPVPPEHALHAGLARPAPVAELVVVVVPPSAIRVGRRRGAPPGGPGPLPAPRVREVTARGRPAAPGLDRRQAAASEPGRRRLLALAAVLLEALAHSGIGEAAPDPAPAPGPLDVAAQPGGVAPAPAGPPGGDGEGEGGEAEQRGDERERGEEVEPDEPGGAAAGAGEPREGDGRERRAQRDGRGGEEVVAAGAVGAGPQPDAPGEDRDREQQRHHVQRDDHAVAHPDRHGGVASRRGGGFSWGFVRGVVCQCQVGGRARICREGWSGWTRIRCSNCTRSLSGLGGWTLVLPCCWSGELTDLTTPRRWHGEGSGRAQIFFIEILLI